MGQCCEHFCEHKGHWMHIQKAVLSIADILDKVPVAFVLAAPQAAAPSLAAIVHPASPPPHHHHRPLLCTVANVCGCAGQQAMSHTSSGCSQVAAVLSLSLALSYSSTRTCHHQHIHHHQHDLMSDSKERADRETVPPPLKASPPPAKHHTGCM